MLLNSNVFCAQSTNQKKNEILRTTGTLVPYQVPYRPPMSSKSEKKRRGRERRGRCFSFEAIRTVSQSINSNNERTTKNLKSRYEILQKYTVACRKN